jgi:ADP-heptose:LPS heptosyltransferase
MNTTFVIDGGAGRVITAVPALEKYAMNNPNDDFRVLTAAWENLLWAHPLLQNRTFNLNMKGAFDLFIKNNRLVHPEPYAINGYFNQKLHLIQAFDQEINNTNDHSDLDKINLYLTKDEIMIARGMLNDVRQQKQKEKVIVIQPYGSGMGMQNDRPIDKSFRSLDVDFALQLIYNLSQKYAVVYFGDKQFYHPGDSYSVNFFDKGGDLRMYMALISQCDYFIGVDSVGQHIARAFNIPGTVIMGSTFESNVSYPNHFTIYRNNQLPTYSPIRISGIDCGFADNLNDKTMDFTQDDIEKIIDGIDR